MDAHSSRGEAEKVTPWPESSHRPQCGHLRRTGAETDYPGSTCSPCEGARGENLETCLRMCASGHLSLLLCSVQRWNSVGEMGAWGGFWRALWTQGSNEGCSVHTPREEHRLWKVESWSTRSTTEPVPHANAYSLQTREPAGQSRGLRGFRSELHPSLLTQDMHRGK